jgi:chemotaxis protein methyltransferase CheR
MPEMLITKSPNITATAKLMSVPEPTEDEFNLFRKLVQKELGFEWGDDKKYLLYSRVQRRLQKNKLQTFQNYYDFIEREENKSERQYLYNAVTTTKSEFYREKKHFDFLRKNIFPELKKQISSRKQKLRFWSAGCSGGQEPFTMAMEAHDFFGASFISNGRLRILGSDVNTDVLESAVQGCFAEELLSPIPAAFSKRYFDLASENNNPYHRIKPEIQKLIQFRQFNLMSSDYPIATKFQLIFCRNVLYYLQSERRDFLIKKLVDHLEEGGWLVLGITELGYKIDKMKNRSISIYQKI